MTDYSINQFIEHRLNFSFWTKAHSPSRTMERNSSLLFTVITDDLVEVLFVPFS
ncbi:GL18836 [Drosophila persimilis]|uniref:GL18836 n=1 Tax=Drosophila persimilis TaxID=7234 RepID=B4G8H4_DROPE|nr:GL18836 [Drosophila persimilis]